jgi:HAD superfamily hydrolase (TIGR01509 family)
MILLIPLGGTGQRFKSHGYTKPKALIEVMGKPILFWLMDNLNCSQFDFIYIPYNPEYKDANLEYTLLTHYPSLNFKFFELTENTRGAAETIHLALSALNCQDTSIICVDGDNFYTSDISQPNCNSVVVTTNTDPNPIFSYVTMDQNVQFITNIAEKQKISDIACTGAYSFESYQQLQHYCDVIIKKNIRQQGEFYTSTVIQEMLKDGHKFKMKHVSPESYVSLGTPGQVQEFNYTFLFDLDGTLVHTDHIYVVVWNKILRKYNLEIDETFFDQFIKGKSDNGFLEFLIPSITKDEINAISTEKDRSFIELISDSDADVLVTGAFEFMKSFQNCNIAVVTNCNRASAEFLLATTGLGQYVDFLVSATDCVHSKPHPEPYLTAMEHFQTPASKCFVFEDTYTGYLSAVKAGVQLITIILHEKSSCEMTTLKTHNINDYTTVTIDDLIRTNTAPTESDEYIDLISSTLSYLPLKKIESGHDTIKTGYICDIDSYKLTYNNGDTQRIVLKMSNFDNELSKTAKLLNMYENEAYFYNHLSKIMNVDVPVHHGVFEHDGKHGIIMENLNLYNGTFGIDLNKNINLLLRVVNDAFTMHNKFHVTCEEELVPGLRPLRNVSQIEYYQTLVTARFDTFMKKNNHFLSTNDKKILRDIYESFPSVLETMSSYPLTLCHGDLKSPNIFYKNDTDPCFLDWQYIHMNKGVSDIAFLLVESIEFNKHTVDLVINYYYQLCREARPTEYYDYEEYRSDLQMALCIFPFFVCVWFNSEDPDKLLDQSFPIRFMKNLMKYYHHFM